MLIWNHFVFHIIMKGIFMYMFAGAHRSVWGGLKLVNQEHASDKDDGLQHQCPGRILCLFLLFCNMNLHLDAYLISCFRSREIFLFPMSFLTISLQPSYRNITTLLMDVSLWFACFSHHRTRKSTWDFVSSIFLGCLGRIDCVFSFYAFHFIVTYPF